MGECLNEFCWKLIQRHREIYKLREFHVPGSAVIPRWSKRMVRQCIHTSKNVSYEREAVSERRSELRGGSVLARVSRLGPRGFRGNILTAIVKRCRRNRSLGTHGCRKNSGRIVAPGVGVTRGVPIACRDGSSAVEWRWQCLY